MTELLSKRVLASFGFKEGKIGADDLPVYSGKTHFETLLEAGVEGRGLKFGMRTASHDKVASYRFKDSYKMISKLPPIKGLRTGVMIIDDPLKAGFKRTDAGRGALKDWYKEGFATDRAKSAAEDLSKVVRSLGISAAEAVEAFSAVGRALRPVVDKVGEAIKAIKELIKTAFPKSARPSVLYQRAATPGLQPDVPEPRGITPQMVRVYDARGPPHLVAFGSLLPSGEEANVGFLHTCRLFSA
jgi:hypothetical protein